MKKSYKKFKIITLLGILAVLTVGVLSFVFSAKEDSVTFFSMDTAVTVKVRGGKAEDYKKIVQKLDGLFDKNDENSEIFRLNQNMQTDLSDETVDILNISKTFCEKNPQIDITAGELMDLWDVNGAGNVPDESEISAVLENIGIENLEINGNKATLKKGKIDLGCVAKGYACDVLRAEFERNHVKCAVATFGSSSVLFGEKDGGEKFSVGVCDPENTEKNLGILHLTECFVSTSGGYERFFQVGDQKFCHILDLQTGRPVVTDILSVTVVGQAGWYTDFLSTLIYIKGAECLDGFFAQTDVELVVVCEGKTVYVSSALKDDFELENEEYKVVFR